MGYSLHSASVGLKMLAAWWNEFVFAIGDIDNRVLAIEAPVDALDTVSRAVPAGTAFAGIAGAALTITFNAPPGGKIWVHVGVETTCTASGAAAGDVLTSAVLSGATSRVANRERSVVVGAAISTTTRPFAMTKTFLLTGLASGSHTLTMVHSTSLATGITGTVTNRTLGIQPL